MDVDVLASIVFLSREFRDPVTGRGLTREDCAHIDSLHKMEFRLVDLWDNDCTPPSTILQTAKRLNQTERRDKSREKAAKNV